MWVYYCLNEAQRDVEKNANLNQDDIVSILWVKIEWNDGKRVKKVRNKLREIQNMHIVAQMGDAKVRMLPWQHSKA